MGGRKQKFSGASELTQSHVSLGSNLTRVPFGPGCVGKAAGGGESEDPGAPCCHHVIARQSRDLQVALFSFPNWDKDADFSLDGWSCEGHLLRFL